MGMTKVVRWLAIAGLVGAVALVGAMPASSQAAPSTDLRITSFSDERQTVLPGEFVVLKGSFRNAGTSPVSGAILVLALAPTATTTDTVSFNSALRSTTCSTVGSVITCQLPTLAAGQVGFLSLSLHGPSSGSMTSTLTVDAPGDDVDPSDDTATDVDVVGSPSHDIEATYLFNGEAADVPAVGEVRRVQAYATNRGPELATAVKLVVRWSAGIEATPFNPGACVSAGTRALRCTAARTATGSGSGIWLDLRFLVAGPQTLDLEARGTTGSDPNPSNDRRTVTYAVVPAASDLGLTVEPQSSPRPLGGLGYLDYTVTNAGPRDASGSVFELPLPPTVDLYSTSVWTADSTPRYCDLGTDRVLRCPFPTLPELHDRPPARISVQVRLTTLGPQQLTARMRTAPGAPADPSPANDAASATIEVLPDTADVTTALTVDLAAPRAPVATATFSNAGPGEVAGFAGIVTVTPGLRITSVEGVYGVTTRIETCRIVSATKARCTFEYGPPIQMTVRTEAVGPGASSEKIVANATTTSIDPVANQHRTKVVAIPAA